MTDNLVPLTKIEIPELTEMFEYIRRVKWCVKHGLDPFAQCADGPCETWMLVMKKDLQDG